ncbi:MAG: hypothetical protein U1F35_08775 [Steroidobacteraceae bacterium]
MRKIIRRALPALLVLGLLGAPPGRAHEHSSGEFDVFLSAEALHASGDLHRGDDDSWFNADVVFGLTQHRFRVFGEYFITAEEHDLERLQVGFEFVPETLLWIGRFHQPASAWNTEHHHGRYLQTAITRPSIERWEDEHGIIPQHIVGALLESRRPLGTVGGLQLSAGVGAGPSLGDHEYEPIGVLESTPGRHRLSVSARIAWLPEFVGPTSAGLLYGSHDFKGRNPSTAAGLPSPDVRLNLLGAYCDWYQEPWRVIAAVYRINAVYRGSIRDEDFTAAYAQVERQLPWRLSAFARMEASAGMRASRFVQSFDDHDGDIDLALHRNALGLRWDFARRQALSIEISHVVSLEQRSDDVRLQWSAAVP